MSSLNGATTVGLGSGDPDLKRLIFLVVLVPILYRVSAQECATLMKGEPFCHRSIPIIDWQEGCRRWSLPKSFTASNLPTS
jgi:hypothetical protein